MTKWNHGNYRPRYARLHNPVHLYPLNRHIHVHNGNRGMNPAMLAFGLSLLGGFALTQNGRYGASTWSYLPSNDGYNTMYDRTLDRYTYGTPYLDFTSSMLMNNPLTRLLSSRGAYQHWC